MFDGCFHIICNYTVLLPNQTLVIIAAKLMPKHCYNISFEAHKLVVHKFNCNYLIYFRNKTTH